MLLFYKLITFINSIHVQYSLTNNLKMSLKPAYNYLKFIYILKLSNKFCKVFFLNMEILRYALVACF